MVMSTEICECNFAVGSMVRAKKGSKRCRAMVATIGDSSSGFAAGKDAPTSLCLLWEPVYPHKIANKFLVAPNIISKEAEQEEATVGIDIVEDLLPFESDSCKTEIEASIATWKDRGDQLLRLGDASAATSFYEKALFDSSTVSIGGSIVISVQGFPRIAEVDCFDEDDGTIDVTLIHNGEEATVKASAILLGLLESDPDFLQERILLNLARCMLQLADMDAANRPKYLKSSVLATTLAITLSLFRQGEQDEQSLPNNAQTALVLRCKAFSSLSKWSKASADAKKLIKSGGSGTAAEQGQRLLAGVERKKKMESKKDKKLAKDICRLVQSATAANDSETREEEFRKTALVSPTQATPTLSSTREIATEQRRTDDLHSDNLPDTRSSSISSLILGILSSYFIIALAIALVSVFMSNAVSSTLSFPG